MVNSVELGNLESLMRSFNRPSFIGGGWAIDLAVNEVTRIHKDMTKSTIKAPYPARTIAPADLGFMVQIDAIAAKE
jgi:hypothetical protein